MNAAQARALGWARTAVGVAAVAVPDLALRPWVGRPADRGTARVLARALGGRDLALGLGTLAAGESDLRAWVLAGGFADAFDVIVTVLAFRRLPRGGRWLVLAAAGGGVAAALMAAWRSDDA